MSDEKLKNQTDPFTGNEQDLQLQNDASVQLVKLELCEK